MKPPDSVGKKMKLTARGFAAAVSFNFFSLPNLEGFIISVSFMYETTASFIFEPKNRKNPNIFRQFHVKLTTKKK